MSTSTSKLIVTEDQVDSAAKKAGYRSEDFKKECNAVCEQADKEYIKTTTELKEKIKEAQERIVKITDDEELFSDDEEVNNPVHYQSLCSEANIDCITAMRAAFGDYETSVWCRINAFKYIFRADSKGEDTDIKKAIWYLNKFLELGGYNQ